MPESPVFHASSGLVTCIKPCTCGRASTESFRLAGGLDARRRFLCRPLVSVELSLDGTSLALDQDALAFHAFDSLDNVLDRYTFDNVLRDARRLLFACVRGLRLLRDRTTDCTGFEYATPSLRVDHRMTSHKFIVCFFTVVLHGVERLSESARVITTKFSQPCSYCYSSNSASALDLLHTGIHTLTLGAVRLVLPAPEHLYSRSLRLVLPAPEPPAPELPAPELPAPEPCTSL